MSKKLLVIDADETDLDLEELGINHKAPDNAEIYQLLWGVSPGQPIPIKEFDSATVGEIPNERTNSD